MATALLIADLEGICGVDDAVDLAFGGQGHARACARMTAEVARVAGALREAGYETVRVSDSHRSGSGEANVDAGALPPGATLYLLDDPYAPELFDGVNAVACVGMHAAGGTRGFGAHTVQVHCAVRAGFRLLSETDLVLGLAHDARARVLFVSGDDVLGRSLSPQIPYLCTKRAVSVRTARSAPTAGVGQALRKLARPPGVPAPPPPNGPLALHFKPGLGAGGQHVHGPNFRARYSAALAAIDASSDALLAHLAGAPGTAGFAQSAARLLAAGWK